MGEKHTAEFALLSVDESSTNALDIVDANGTSIAMVVDAETDQISDSMRAYAALFAAAPELMEALKETLKAYEQLMPGLAHIAVQDYANINEAPIKARAALAKAGSHE